MSQLYKNTLSIYLLAVCMLYLVIFVVITNIFTINAKQNKNRLYYAVVWQELAKRYVT